MCSSDTTRGAPGTRQHEPDGLQMTSLAVVGGQLMRRIMILPRDRQPGGLGAQQMHPGMHHMPHDQSREPEGLRGFAGWVLHDIGNAVVDRYHAAGSPVRHAEAAGLMLARLFERNDFGLSENEQLAIKWAVTAHTH